ncbi:LysR substrate-binding domain-containing protein [Nguyenibacter vanlangensis]|uniref:LysR substrate-binding domain-containing protein n=1 Tax=Nguyenibacter vanlangensis TaxID=1216886 RepID=A0ABZ3D6N1_9PROT
MGGESNILHIGASSSIAVRLILPHLDTFRAFYPSITVRMITPTTLNELLDGTIDGAFFFEIDDNINIRHESLISEQIIPIASPSLSKEISKMKFRIPEAQWRLDVLPENWTSSSWNFPLMIPCSG